jgi:BirA family transcriptional regulator, biotin operon repressor / biotin---[acetyl-CoA-carboxylase] ligase
MIEVSSRGVAPVSCAGAPPLGDQTGISLPSFYSLRRYQRLGSTNDEAKSLAGAGAAQGALVWALEQSQGRGRQGKVWASPPGNFYASIVLRPATKPEAAAQLGFAAALAVREACLDFVPDAAISLKWPNDVLLAGRKLAGILLESQMRGDGRIDWLVVGIGINLVTYPLATEYPATALSAEGLAVAPEAMLRAVARRFLAWYQRWCEQRDFEALREAWLRYAHGIGATLRVRQPNGQLSGRFAGLDGDGALLLDTAEGRRRVEAGEVFPAAPAA